MSNPHFMKPDDAAFELPGLIHRLGRVDLSEQLDQDRADMVEAIARHASNVESTLLDGMFSLAHLLVVVGCSDDELPKEHVVGLGALLKHMACEADYVRTTLSNMRHIQQGQHAHKAAGGPARAPRTQKKEK